MSAVDHPKHYNAFGPIEDDGTAKYEPIKVIEAWGMGPEFCIGNALKYIARAPHKGKPIEDLKKAKWYLERAGGRYDGAPGGLEGSRVANGWNLTKNLTLAVIVIADGFPIRAIAHVDREIDRLAKEAP